MVSVQWQLHTCSCPATPPLAAVTSSLASRAQVECRSAKGTQLFLGRSGVPPLAARRSSTIRTPWGAAARAVEQESEVVEDAGHSELSGQILRTSLPEEAGHGLGRPTSASARIVPINRSWNQHAPVVDDRYPGPPNG
jgi:hypothetical protein